MLTSSELTTRRQSRTTYANNIIQAQKVAQGCATRISIGGDEGTLASDITLLHEGAVFTTVEEQTAILAANNCTPTVKQLVYAIPDFKYTVNSIIVLNEPGTWVAVASGLSNPLMNGTYTTTAKNFYYGNMGSNLSVNQLESGSIKSFMRIQPTDFSSFGWLSRSGIDNDNQRNYRPNGTYTGLLNNNDSAKTTINGTVVLGEYVTITTPYYFVLNSYSLVSGHNNRAPPFPYITSWIIVGSKKGYVPYDFNNFKDGDNDYHIIDTQTNVTMIDNNPDDPYSKGGHITIDLPLNTKAYNNYRIIVTANSVSSAYRAASIDSWDLFTYM